MRKKVLGFITMFVMAFSICFVLPSDEAEATQLRNYNFSTNYTITGNGATDIVNVARAQIGRNGGSFGYTEEWCADFVSDCAIKAGQSSAIPADGYCPTLQTKIKNAGGYYVSASDARAGDILFYGSGGSAHVEIVYANNGGVLSTIGGNCGNSDNSLSLVKDHKNQNGQPSVYKAMRPNYKGGKPILPGTVDSSWAVPATVKASNKCNTYDQYGNTESGRWIDAGDSCYIDAVYTNGFVHVEYPAGNTRRWTYAKRENFPLSKKQTAILPGTVDSSWAVPARLNALNWCNTYNEYGNAESDRWIDAGDDCYIDAVYTNGFVHVEYPSGNTRRWAYAKRENFSLSKKETPVNLGNDFSALIINKAAWKPIMVQPNGYVKMGTENQTNMRQEIWHFMRNNDGSYRIQSYYNGKVLDADCSKDEDYTNILTWDNGNQANQQWYIYNSGDAFKIRPKYSSTRFIDMQGNDSSDGTPIILYTGNESAAQRWAIYQFNFVGSSTLSCNNSTAYAGTKFTWTKANYANKYTLKIWKNKLWEGNSVYEKTTTDTFLTVSLPEGTYEAYIDAANNYSYLKGNTLRFTVGACTHKWSSWNTTKEANCSETGSQTRKCSLCGKTETQTITNPNGHIWSKWTTTKDATCSQQGSQTKKCYKCGKTTTSPIDKNTNHKWSEWKTRSTSTGNCTYDEIQERTCQWCGKVETRSNGKKPNNHKWSEWTITKPATCSIDGQKTRKCEWCNKTETQTIAKTNGHIWSAWTVTKSATFTAEGQKTRKCSICGKTEIQSVAKLNLPGVVPKVEEYSDSKGNNVKITWNACENATGYTIRIYDSKAENVLYIYPQVTGTSYIAHLPTGTYQVGICSVNRNLDYYTWEKSRVSFVIKKKGYDPNRKPVASEVKKLQQLLTKTAKLAANEDLVDMFDANGDGKVNVIDVLILKRRALK